VSKSRRAVHGRVRRGLHAVLAALIWLAPFAEEGRGEEAAPARVEARGEVAPAGPGATLRAGIEALEAGDAERAARLFAAVVDHHPIVADHGFRLRLKALLALSQHATAVRLAAQFEAAYPDSPLRGEVSKLLGDAHDALGAAEAARAAWRRARALARDAETRAALDLSIAASFERSGRDSDASSAYLSVWSSVPTSEEARRAEEALERLEARTGWSLRTPAEFAKRARALSAAGANQEALASFDRALGGDLPLGAHTELQRERALTLFRLRRYPDAEAAFAELGEGAEDRFWRARSLARSGRVDESIREFEKLSGGRFDALAARSLLIAGILREDEADRARALAHYVRVASEAPTRELRAEARWRLGWCAYQEGRYAEATEHFTALLEAIPDPLERLGARYWRARSLEKLGARAADEELRALAIEYPLSYYGWRAAGRVGESSLLRQMPERSQPSPVSFEPAKTWRIAILIEAGLREEALVETGLLAEAAQSLDDRLEIAHLFSAAGQFQRAERAVVDPYAERLARGPEPGLEALWWFAWPTAFADLVTAASTERSIAPPLLNAVMREESGFDPRAVSTAGARGLTQIMPATGERLAASLGLPDYRPEDLFAAARNLLLGAHYLEQLLERFEGRVSAAVASYNAGPEAVERWLEERPDVEDDEWVEAIPYDQTRAYVKRVLRSQQVYRVLY